MTVYRDANTSELSTFAMHISIAETLLGVNADLRAQLSTDEPELYNSYLQTWGDLWEQLDQARAIVVRLSRDVSTFDAARVRAGNPFHAAAGMIPITNDMHEATLEAMGALRANVPEVAVEATSKPTAGNLEKPRRRLRLSPFFWLHVGSLIAIVLFAIERGL